MWVSVFIILIIAPLFFFDDMTFSIKFS